ncbi:hypothetical protein NZ698_11135 [Chryseobacterium sp. PBS4-4]|uniref:Uncharacterized protein n=1 Tax=Chryseobacterium edaphi TaxID=2976532 RepID=A0ABT2W720_9FLAO|nr:hypothetical protein [Chryseobacterium edaphi]MCU7617753.1 hypothetical protein [Chryseobacterium edaphi]
MSFWIFNINPYLNDQMTYIYSGGGGQIILWLGYKLLKKTKVYIICFILAVLLAVLGYLNIDNKLLMMPNGNAAFWSFLPLLFLIYYSILRKLFLVIYGNEPLMKAYMQSSWEQGEYRRLHYGDALFTVLTLILPFLTTLLF